MRVAVIKYNAGNIQSVSYALERLKVNYVITNIAEEIRACDKVIFPGVGEASSTMAYLIEHKLNRLICELKQPVLGVCLGMQLMCKYSEENNTGCLGIFDEVVKKFEPSENYKVPHMGWNQLTQVTDWLSPALENQNVYFVHGYYVPESIYASSITQYTIPFSSSLHKENFYGVQFHPEKSSQTGELVIESFLKL